MNFAIILLWIHCTFGFTTIEFRVQEDVSNGYLVGNLKQHFGVLRASDITLVRQGIAAAFFFSYDTTSGNLTTRGMLDRDGMCEASELCCHRMRECLMELKFVIKPSEVRYVKVYIQDRNDHTPQFEQITQPLRISENAQIGTRLRLPLAKDIDSLEFSVKNYELKTLSSNNNGVFILYTETFPSIEEQRAGIKAVYLQLKRSLDRELVSKYEYELHAIDGGMPALTGSTTLTVNVIDENDNFPVFDKSSYEVEVEENKISREPIIQVKATDPDLNENGQVAYYLDEAAAKEIKDHFSVSLRYGKVFQLRALDFEKMMILKVPIIATDMRHPTTSSVTLTVHVKDANDEAPLISVDYLGKVKAQIEENKPEGEVIAFLTVTDKDSSSQNRNVKCVLPLELHRERYDLTPNLVDNDKIQEYFLKTLVSLDRERTASDAILVTCTDSGIPPLSSTATISLIVLDVNDHKPELSLRTLDGKVVDEARIMENVRPNTPVIKIHIEDLDNGANGSVTLNMDQSEPATRERFHIKMSNPLEGILVTTSAIDREATQPPINSFTVVVVARDNGGYSNEMRFLIHLIDVNDNAPEFEEKPQYFRVKENLVVNLGTIKITDLDNNTDINVAIHRDDMHLALPFRIEHKPALKDQSSSNSLVIIRPLDSETQAVYNFRLVARDGWGSDSRSSTGTVIVNVENVNDNQPIIVFPSDNSSNHVVSFQENIGYVVLKVIAKDKDSEHEAEKSSNLHGQLVYSLKADDPRDNMFEIDPNSGEIAVSRRMTAEDKGAKSLTVTIVDQGVPKLQTSRHFTIIVDDSIPHLTRHNNNSPSNTAHDAERNTTDYNSVMIIVLVFFLLLIVGILSLVVYMRYWSGQISQSRGTHNFRNLCLVCYGSESSIFEGSKTMRVVEGPVSKLDYLKGCADKLEENCVIKTSNLQSFPEIADEAFMSQQHQQHSFSTMSYATPRNYEPVVAERSECRSMRTPHFRRQNNHEFDSNYTPNNRRRAQPSMYDTLASDGGEAHHSIAESPRSAMEVGHFYQTIASEGATSRAVGGGAAFLFQHRHQLSKASPLPSPKLTSKHINQSSSQTLSIDNKLCRPTTLENNDSVSKNALVELPAFIGPTTMKSFSSVQASFV